MHVFLGPQMSNGHFICPLDISNVHWIQWTIGHYPLSINPRCRFPVVTKSGLVHWIQLTLKHPMDDIQYVHWALDMHMSNGHVSCPLDPMDSHMSNGHFICPLDICVSIGHVWVLWAHRQMP